MQYDLLAALLLHLLVGWTSRQIIPALLAFAGLAAAGATPQTLIGGAILIAMAGIFRLPAAAA